MKQLKYDFCGTDVELCEDVYILDSRGIAFLRREYEPSGTFSLFDMLEEDERSFIVNHRTTCPTHKLLLVASREGKAILVDCIFYARYRVLCAIVPHFGFDVIKSLMSIGFDGQLIVSPMASKALAECKARKHDRIEKQLAFRICNSHPLRSAYQLDNAMNMEIAEELLGLASNYSRLYGCDMSVETQGLDEFDMDNATCLYSFGLIYACMCLIIRKFSSARGGTLTINFCTVGVYCDVEFSESCELDEEDADHTMRTIDRVNAIFTACGVRADVMNSTDTICLRFFPWRNIPHSGDIKQLPKEIIY